MALRGRDPRDLPTMTPMQGYHEVYQLFVPGIGAQGSLFPTAMQFRRNMSVMTKLRPGLAGPAVSELGYFS